MAAWPELAPLIERAGRPLVIEALRAWADARRGSPEVADATACARWCEARLASLVAPSQRRVFNLTGTVLHTNLGRALLAEEAIEAAVEAMRSPTTLEYELDDGGRGERDDHISPWLCRSKPMRNGSWRSWTGRERAFNRSAKLPLLIGRMMEGRSS